MSLACMAEFYHKSGLAKALRTGTYSLSLAVISDRPLPPGGRMPFGGFINAIPMPVFLVIHLAAFAIGAFFAKKSFGGGQSEFGWGFTLFALAEISYLTYH